MNIQEITMAMAKAMNSEAGQKITEKLIEEVKKQNPNITMQEWKEIQSRFLAYMTIKMTKEIARA